MIHSLIHLASWLTVACVSGLWQGLALASLGAAVCALMPRASASLRHSFLIAVFLGALVLPWIHLQASMSGETHRGLAISPWIASLVAFVWLTASSVRAAQLFLAWRHLCFVRRTAIPIQSHCINDSRRGRRRVLLCESTQVTSPSILGFGSPRLLLPTWMVPLLSESELRQIALHEYEHLRRGDDWINLMLQVGILLSPLNPALPWLNGRIRVQRELAVDAAVIDQAVEPLSYAACLTRLAMERRERRSLRLALAALEGQSELARRVRALLERPSLWTGRQSAGAASLAAIALLFLATTMTRAPRLVSVGMAPSVTQALPVAASNVMTKSLYSGGRPAAQIVPASFDMTSSRTAGLYLRRRKRNATRAMNFSPERTTMEMPDRRDGHGRPTAHLPAGSLTAPRPYSSPMLLPSIRLIRTEFYSPYIAVPTSNGWLLIQL